jgi:Leucine-rich repeat (LRR) protein
MKEKKILKGGKVFYRSFKRIDKAINPLNLIYPIELNKKKKIIISMVEEGEKEPFDIAKASISPNEIVINKYITLKLENGITNIYVEGILFRNCKYILISIPNKPIAEEIDSIDDAKDLLSNAHESDKQLIDPETEFWAHASNLQAWVEHDYDTRIVHRNLAFPLLVALARAGDKKARFALKEEIFLRLESGSANVTQFLINGKYFNYLTKEEFELLSDNDIFVEKFIDGGYYKKLNHTFLDSIFSTNYAIENITELNLSNKSIKLIPRSITKLKNLLTLNISNNLIRILPPNISDLINLKSLELSNNNIIKLPESIGDLSKLEHLDVHTNNLIKLPESIGNLKSLKTFFFRQNQLITLPDSFSNLTSLLSIDGVDNNIITLPEGIFRLPFLESLYLQKNEITHLPEDIYLPNLLSLKLSNNLLKEIPKSLNKAEQLEKLYIDSNILESLPLGLKLNGLKNLNLSSNNLASIPKCITNLNELSQLNLSRNDIYDISDELIILSNLKTIDLSYNKIEVVSDLLLDMMKLVEVNLEYNEIKTLSQPLINSGIIKIKGNPLPIELRELIASIGEDGIFDLKKLKRDFNRSEKGKYHTKEIKLLTNNIAELITEDDEHFHIAKNSEVAKEVAIKILDGSIIEIIRYNSFEHSVFFTKEMFDSNLNIDRMRIAISENFDKLVYNEWDAFFTQNEILEAINMELEEGYDLSNVWDKKIFNTLYSTVLFTNRKIEYTEEVLESTYKRDQLFGINIYDTYLKREELIESYIEEKGWLEGVLDRERIKRELPNGRVYWQL